VGNGNFFKENVSRSHVYFEKYIPWDLIYTKSALIQEMSWCHYGAKPFLEPTLTKT